MVFYLGENQHLQCRYLEIDFDHEIGLYEKILLNHEMTGQILEMIICGDDYEIIRAIYMII
jgi:hypothetical protein